jgi:hypothetical protein
LTCDGSVLAEEVSNFCFATFESSNGKGAAGLAGSQPVEMTITEAITNQTRRTKTFTYFPYPAVPTELQGYAGSKVGGAGLYRLTVDAQGAVTQVTILKGFTVAAGTMSDSLM